MDDSLHSHRFLDAGRTLVLIGLLRAEEAALQAGEAPVRFLEQRSDALPTFASSVLGGLLQLSSRGFTSAGTGLSNLAKSLDRRDRG